MEAAYCIALRARTNSGTPFGSKPLNPVMVVSVITMPAEFMPKSSPLWMRPGQAIHQDAVARARADVEDDVPARARDVAGPVVVADDDPAVPGVAAGGDERAAVARARPERPVLVVSHGVVAELDARVQRDDVPQVHLHAAPRRRRRRSPGSPRGTRRRLRGQRIFSAALRKKAQSRLPSWVERELRDGDRVRDLGGEERSRAGSRRRAGAPWSRTVIQPLRAPRAEPFKRASSAAVAGRARAVSSAAMARTAAG